MLRKDDYITRVFTRVVSSNLVFSIYLYVIYIDLSKDKNKDTCSFFSVLLRKTKTNLRRSIRRNLFNTNLFTIELAFVEACNI